MRSLPSLGGPDYTGDYMQLTSRARRTGALIFAAAIVLAAFAAVSPAQAAVGTRLTAMNIGYLGAGMTPVLIVSSTLPDTVELPAEVEFSVPTGAQVAWFGELAGTGNHIDDPQRDTYELDRTEDGWDIYRATITEFRSFQVEASTPPVFTETGGGKATATITYSPAMAADTAFLGVEVPKGYNPSQTVGFTLLGTGLSGEVWGQEVAPFEIGQVASYEFSYEPGVTGGAQPGSATTVITILTVAAVVVLMGLIGYAVSRRMAD